MNEKRRLLIDTAFRLFYENGINGVGINEILAVSGIAKKTLYSHFASKDELVIATLQERDTVFLTWLDGELKHSNSSREVIPEAEVSVKLALAYSEQVRLLISQAIMTHAQEEYEAGSRKLASIKDRDDSGNSRSNSKSAKSAAFDNLDDLSL